MSFKNKSVLITGSSGFIGNAFFNRIIELSPSQIQLLDIQQPKHSQQVFVDKHDNIDFIQADIRDINEYSHRLKSIDVIIHFAAQPSVPISTDLPYFDFDVNVIGSMRMLEFARKNDIDEFVFAASGGTIYGETDSIPTDEFERLNPISNYGAAKAAFEMYLRSYASLYSMKTTSLRFGNIFGPGSTHGVMYDFYRKLKNNPDTMQILGDGNQKKSYLYIDDCIDGFILAASRSDSGFQEYNLSGVNSVSVTEIAELVSKYMGLSPRFEYTGGDRGWRGDVRFGAMDTNKIKQLGWKQRTSFEKGVSMYIQSLNM